MTTPLASALRACLVGWLLAFGIAGNVWAQATYQADSSPAAAAAYPWIDISGSGNAVALQDNAVSAPVNLGFGFAYGNTSYTQLRISSNGMLHFGATSTAFVNGPLPLNGTAGKPAIDAVMLPLWDDLQPGNTSSHVRHATLGSAPNRVFVVSWLAVPFWCLTDNPSVCNPAKDQTKNAFATFQVQLHEQGQFVYRYQAVNGSGGAHTGGATFRNPAGATVGYELNDGDFVQYAYRMGSVGNGTTILWNRRLGTPGRFNGFETSTPTAAVNGVIRTKVAGAPFTLAVVALNTAKTAVLTSFSGDVKVELMNSGDNSGAVDANTGCRSSWTVAAGSSAYTLTFAAADLGRKNLTLSENNAWRDARLRISYPATGTPTVSGCSTDNFAIRPARFDAIVVQDNDAQTPGSTRNLDNTAASGGNVHKAGRPFTIGTRALNAQAVPAVTSNYGGTPAATLTRCGGPACPANLGELLLGSAAVAGVMNDSTATYDEAGAFTLQLDDSGFASVDNGDGSSDAEMTIASPARDVGRFVPDHFELSLLATPRLKTFDATTCVARSFTYVGQPFGYVSVPQAVLSARNAAGEITSNYTGALWKLNAASLSQTYAAAGPALSVSSLPTLLSNGDGTGVVGAGSGDTLRFDRSPSSPVGAFTADITLGWSVTDDSEAAVAGNGSIQTPTPLAFPSIAFDAGSEFRYGMLKLTNAYGSELNNLPALVEAQYWNGSAFVTNSADHCTTLASGSMAMGNYQRNLSACETAIVPAPLRLASGRGFFTLRRPGGGNSGSVDLTLELGGAASGQTCAVQGGTAVAATAANLPWLQGRWGGAANYDTNPRARASFGQYKSPLLYLRESF